MTNNLEGYCSNPAELKMFLRKNGIRTHDIIFNILYEGLANQYFQPLSHLPFYFINITFLYLNFSRCTFPYNYLVTTSYKLFFLNDIVKILEKILLMNFKNNVNLG